MGLFFGKKKQPEQTGRIELSATYTVRDTTDTEIWYLDHGYIPMFDLWFPPDAVFTGDNKKSEVYHAMPHCCGVYVSNYPDAMSEDGAKAMGLRRCKKCDWKTHDENRDKRPEEDRKAWRAFWSIGKPVSWKDIFKKK